MTNTLSDIYQKINKFSPNDCWIWTGYKINGGYGMVGYNGESVLVHRLIYSIEVGPVSSLLDLDHLCKNRACCNPAHLEPVTHLENVLRGNTGKHNLTKTCCRHGHEYSDSNTAIITGKNGKPERVCKQCRLEAHKRYELLHPTRKKEY
jgi:hypothetical protein